MRCFSVVPVAGLAAVLAVACGSPVAAQSAGWQLDATSSRHADALPLNRLDADDVASEFRPRSGRNVAYVRDELRVSRSDGAHTWSLLARQNATLVASADALDMAHALETAGTPATSRRWNVHARYRGFAGAGMAWQRQFDVAAGWQAHVGVQGLLLSQWREFEMEGPASFDAALQQWSFDLRYRRADSRLEFPFQREFAARGQALLTNGGVRWASPSWSAAVSWRDAGWLRWRGLPHQDAVLSSNTQAVDADGYVVYKPLVQGQFSQPDARRTLTGVVNVQLAWAQDAATEWAAGFDRLAGFGLLPQLKVRHRVGDVTLSARYDVHERRVGLGGAWGGWQVALGTDRLDGDARSREFLVAYRWAPR